MERRERKKRETHGRENEATASSRLGAFLKANGTAAECEYELNRREPLAGVQNAKPEGTPKMSVNRVGEYGTLFCARGLNIRGKN